MHPNAASLSRASETCTHKASVDQLANQLSLEDTAASSDSLVEAVKVLLHDVAELKKRCDGLEVANLELKGDLKALQEPVVRSDTPAPSEGNEPTYASSDATEVEQSPSSDLAEVKQQLELTSKVLQMFDSRLKALETHQDDLDRRFERKGYDQTSMKGRIGAVEKRMKSLEDEYHSPQINGSNGHLFNGSGNSPSEVGHFLTDELQRMQMRLTNHELKCDDTQKDLCEKCDVLTAAIQDGGNNSPSTGWVITDLDGSEEKKIKAQLATLAKSVADIKTAARNRKIIDEASTRDALYMMFHQLSEIMTRDNNVVTWCEEPFEVTSDEAFGLRDHVLCRLAIFGQYAAALKDAKAAKASLPL